MRAFKRVTLPIFFHSNAFTKPEMCFPHVRMHHVLHLFFVNVCCVVVGRRAAGIRRKFSAIFQRKQEWVGLKKEELSTANCFQHPAAFVSKFELQFTLKTFSFFKRPQVIDARALPRIGYALITAKTHVKIHFVQYLNYN